MIGASRINIRSKARKIHGRMQINKSTYIMIFGEQIINTSHEALDDLLFFSCESRGVVVLSPVRSVPTRVEKLFLGLFSTKVLQFSRFRP
jgi:hypothetical protein